MEVLADLIHSGAIQHLDYIYIDFHKWMDKDHRSFRYLIYISESRELRFKTIKIVLTCSDLSTWTGRIMPY